MATRRGWDRSEGVCVYKEEEDKGEHEEEDKDEDKEEEDKDNKEEDEEKGNEDDDGKEEEEDQEDEEEEKEKAIPGGQSRILRYASLTQRRACSTTTDLPHTHTHTLPVHHHNHHHQTTTARMPTTHTSPASSTPTSEPKSISRPDYLPHAASLTITCSPFPHTPAAPTHGTDST